MNHLVITGGSGGLGNALVRAFDGPDWQITSAGRGELDVTDANAVRGYFKDRAVDLLVCAAGITRDALLIQMDESKWDEVLAVNFQGAASCAKAALEEMSARGSGHILFISSQSAQHPPNGQSAYATAKAALHGLASALAQKHGQRNIRVNTIVPGFLETPMTATVTTVRRSEILADHALGRFNTAANVASFIRHLHEHQPHASGQLFQLDSRIS